MQAWPRYREQATTQKTHVNAQFLPFADDFSYFGPYPDPNRWVNSTSVFVNHTKATKPVTIGVATFDGLRANGYPYNPSASTGSSDSDTLTSIPLRLDSMNGTNIIPTDSVRLRFYYQPRGMWEKPESGDELALDFYNPTAATWTNVWLKSGFSPPDSLFTRIMIAITDTAYLKDGFQFRFRNKSSLSGDVDHWHLDAVYIDKNLDPDKDTIEPEIAFSYDLRSILKNYAQMPFNQFTGANDMQSNFDVYYNLRNNNTTGVNLTTYYQIQDNAGLIVAQNTNGTNNVPTFGTSGYCSDASLVNPSLNNFVYNSGTPFTDSTSYLLKFFATNISDNVHSNDTIYYRQKFHNYFAYDDGSAEAGYGFASSGGVTAVRYKLNAPDTLRAVDIFFDPVMGVSSLQNAGIKVRVWADNGGLPGMLYPDSAFWGAPVFSQNGFDVFQRYQLVDPIIFTSAATFYVGIEQQLNLSLNVGYDLNNDSHTNILFNVGSGWNVSSFKGSLMMRPVFGDSMRAVGIEAHTNANAQAPVSVYPNPAGNEVFVSSKEGISKAELCDMLGNVLIQAQSGRFYTAALPAGFYLVRTYTQRGNCAIQKLLIAR